MSATLVPTIGKIEGLNDAAFLTLEALSQQEGKITVGKLQRALRVKAAHMSRILNSLEQHDPPLSMREIHPTDKRKINVWILPEGLNVLNRNRPKIAEQAAKRIADFLQLESEVPSIELKKSMLKVVVALCMSDKTFREEVCKVVKE